MTWRAQTLLVSLVGLNAQQFSTSISEGLNLGIRGSHANSSPLKTPGAERQGFCGRNEEGIKFLGDFHPHVMRASFFFPIKASPAPLTKTQEQNDTVL